MKKTLAQKIVSETGVGELQVQLIYRFFEKRETVNKLKMLLHTLVSRFELVGNSTVKFEKVCLTINGIPVEAYKVDRYLIINNDEEIKFPKNKLRGFVIRKLMGL